MESLIFGFHLQALDGFKVLSCDAIIWEDEYHEPNVYKKVIKNLKGLLSCMN